MQKLDEKIDVVSVFVGGKVNIIRFRWKNTVLSVDKITGRWTTREGPFPVYNFSVLVNKNDIYELSFNSRTLSWRINTIYLD